MSKLQEIEIDAVKLKHLFPIRFGGDHRQLLSSVQTHGILYPPKLYQYREKLWVLDGLDRIKAAQECGFSSFHSEVLSESDLSYDKAFLLALELNKWSRSFNLVEKAQLLKEAYQIFAGQNIPRSFWHTVGISHNIRAIQQHKELLKLPEMIKKYAVNNNTPLATILGFLRFKPDEVEKVASQLFQLPLNQNKLSEVLSLLLEISIREDKSVLSILESIWPQLEVEFSPHQKEQALRSVLQQRRNPSYEKKLSEFQQKVEKLPLDKSKTRINPAPFFEDDYIDVSTRFASQEDVNNFINVLKDPTWVEILKPKS